jgi:hypothetical protein
MEAEPAIKRNSGRIGLVHLEEQRLGTLRVQLAQNSIHELPAKPAAPVGARHHDGQDVGLAGRKARQHETCRRMSALAHLTCGEAEHRILRKQRRELLVGPRPAEAFGMKRCGDGAFSGRHGLERIFAPQG